MLQWAQANGCEWISDTCWAAARGGHLEVLQWARANGCEWDATVTVLHYQFWQSIIARHTDGPNQPQNTLSVGEVPCFVAGMPLCGLKLCLLCPRGLIYSPFF